MDKRWLTISAGVATSAIIAYQLIRDDSYLRRRIKNYLHPYVKIGTVSDLYLYPLKSGCAKKVNEFECTPIGPKLDEWLCDRQLMLINADEKRMISGRNFPQLVLVDCNIDNNRILTLSLNSDTSNRVSNDMCTIIDNQQIHRILMHNGLRIEGYDCGDEIADWLKAYLKTIESIRLIYYVRGVYTERDVVPKKEWMNDQKWTKRCDPAAYQDFAPYMAMTTSSLDDLNSKFVDRSFSMVQFRPSIVVDGVKKFDEDYWDEVRIGDDVEFVCYRPCTRCVMTLIDPITGESDKNMQPLKKLREYRLAPGKLRSVYKDSPVYGTVMGLNKAGRIRCGDSVYVRYKSTEL